MCNGLPVSVTRPKIGTLARPGGDATAVRGDTVTLTVSSGPKQVNVPNLLTWDKGDAVGELEDRGFAVNVVNAPVTSNDQVDTVLAQSPSGGGICCACG